MQRRYILVLACLVLCAIGSVLVWFSSNSSVGGQASAAKFVGNGSSSTGRLGIEIGLNKPFTVPAALAGHTLEAFLRVPANAGAESDVGPVSAIKLAPKMVGVKIEVTVYVLSGDISLIKSCKDWDMLKETRLTSFTLSEGDQTTVPSLSNLGTNFKNGTLTFKVVPFPVRPDDTDCGCGRCGDLYCCPNPGACIGCGPCGDVCCRKGTE